MTSSGKLSDLSSIFVKGTYKQGAYFSLAIHPFIILVLAVSDQASIELREPLNLRELEVGRTCPGLHTAEELTWKYWQKCSMKYSWLDWVCQCGQTGTKTLCITTVFFIYETSGITYYEDCQIPYNTSFPVDNNLNTPVCIWVDIFHYWEFSLVLNILWNFQPKESHYFCKAS